MINFAISAAGYPVFHYYKPDSSITEAQIFAKCGSAHEDQDSWGVAHFLEHMCFQGTPNKNKHQISREMALIGNYNAYTNYFCTCYHFDSLNESFESGFRLLKESVFDSCYPEHEFEKEKSVIVEEWRMYDNYPSEAYKNFSLQHYFGSSEGHPIIGTEESILSMNPEKLHRYRNKWYGKNNIAIIVVGGVTFEKVMAVINEVVPVSGEVEEVPVCLRFYNYQEETQKLETSRYDQSVYGLIQPWYNSQEILDKNYIPNFLLRASSTYLYEYIRDDLGLCYGIKQGRMCHFNQSYLTTYLLTNKDYIQKAEEELFKSYSKMKTEGFPEEIFNIAKVQAIYGQLKTLQDVSGIGYSMASLLLQNKDPDWIVNKGSLYLSEPWLKQKAANLTPKDLQEAASVFGEIANRYVMIPVAKNN